MHYNFSRKTVWGNYQCFEAGNESEICTIEEKVCCVKKNNIRFDLGNVKLGLESGFTHLLKLFTENCINYAGTVSIINKFVIQL